MRRAILFRFFSGTMVLLLTSVGIQFQAWAASVNIGADVTRTLYFGPGTGAGGLFRLNLDMPNVAESIVQVNLVNTSTGIALDRGERKLYWIADTQSGSTDKVRRSNLDGTDIELFLTPAGQPEDIEIDSLNNRLYWSERFTDSINVIDLNGNNQQQLISTIEPRGMDIDFNNEYLYWVEFSSNRLRRAKTDGSNAEDVISTGMNRPFDVTVDPVHDRLYWVELGPLASNVDGRVWTANLDGSDPVLIADQQFQPTDLVLDPVSNSIFWGADGTLRRADLDGNNATTVSVPPIGYRNLALDVVRVPEPSTIVLLGIASVVAIFPRWRMPPHTVTHSR